MRLPTSGDIFAARYRIVEVLGEGGFATVFRATDESRRNVALKILKPDANGKYSAEIHARFGREVRMLARLRDPHTVRLFDFGHEARSDLLYMVFEYVPGRDLSEVLADAGRLGPEIATRVARQILYSLREAHEVGLLHRDLKPQNVRVYEYMGDRWRVKLLDFGIARPIQTGEPAITRAGELIGTPRYMSPEQLTERELTPASDLYSVGLMTLEMLLGPEALQGNRWADQLDRLHTGHVFSVDHLESIGPKLTAIVARLSALDTAHRFQNVDEVLRALDAPRSAPAPSTAAPQPTLAGDADEPGDRRLAWFALIVLVAVSASVIVQWTTPEPTHKPPALTKRAEKPPFVLSHDLTTAPDAQTILTVRRDGGEPDGGEPDGGEPDGGETDVTTLAELPLNATPGCGEEPPFRGRAKPLQHGLFGDWLVHVPASYRADHAYPVVVLFHEDRQNPRIILDMTGFDKAADERGYIVIAPHDENHFLAWRRNPGADRIYQMVEAAGQELCVDLRRIALVGHASGGRAADFLSCQPWVWAFVTTSYRSETNDAAFLCYNAGPVNHLHIGPTESERMPLEGGLACPIGSKRSLAESDEVSRKRNGCGDRKRVWATRDGGTCHTWSCDKHFVSCHTEGGHGWPGGGGGDAVPVIDCDPPPTHQFPATEIIANFLDELEPR